MSGLNTVTALLEARNEFPTSERENFDKAIIKQLSERCPDFKPVVFRKLNGEWTAGFLLERLDSGGIRVLIPSGEWRVVRAKQSASVVAIEDTQRSMFDMLLSAQDKFHGLLKLLLEKPPAKGSAKNGRTR